MSQALSARGALFTSTPYLCMPPRTQSCDVLRCSPSRHLPRATCHGKRWHPQRDSWSEFRKHISRIALTTPTPSEMPLAALLPPIIVLHLPKSCSNGTLPHHCAGSSRRCRTSVWQHPQRRRCRSRLRPWPYREDASSPLSAAMPSAGLPSSNTCCLGTSAGNGHSLGPTRANPEPYS